MSLSLNIVHLAGNLTRDPEVRFLNDKSAVVNFGLAINRRWKSNGEAKEEVTFIDIEAWGKTAELVGQYLTKGRGCFVEGRLKLDQWDDKESGQKRSRLKVVAERVHFLGDARNQDDEPEEAPAPRAKKAAAPAPRQPVDDEPPF